MQSIRELIVADLEQRIEDEITLSHRQLKVLMVVKVDDWFDRVMVSVFMYTRKKKGNNGKKLNLFVETIVAIGEAFMRHYKLKVDSGQAAKIGAFILYSFEKLGMIEVYLTNAGGKHAQYCVRVTNDDNLAELYTGVVVERVPKYPSTVPYEPFTTGRHPCGTALVKTQSSSILKALNPVDHPIVFKTVNRKMAVPWVIDKELLNIANTCFENQSPAFNSIWTVENPEARESKSRETSITLDMAYKFADVPFYHFYTLDFRGRVYCSTAFLNEQGGDLAKGILRRQEKKPIGVKGFYWLMVSIASNWAGNSGMYGNAKTDKIPLDSRYKWALDNEKDFLNYAHMPFENTGWMDADSPWQFLSNCIELKRFRDWQKINGRDNYEFESNIIAYLDGTTNGSQHLTALTRDHTVAPFVNLVKTELPGDLYRYVADNVWHELEVKYNAFDELAPFRLLSAKEFVSKMVELKKAYKLGTSESSKTKLLKDMQDLRQSVPKLLFDDSYVIFFRNITDLKERRKIVKRNVMTVPLI